MDAEQSKQISVLAEKWGPASCILVAMAISAIYGMFLGVPTLWEYYADKSKQETEMQRSQLAAVLTRLESGNDKLTSIRELLKKNNDDMTAGFSYTTRTLEQIAAATGKMSRGAEPPPMAQRPSFLPPLLIPPSLSFCPRPPKTPNT